MHAVQSSFKFNMPHCMKLQIVRLYSMKQGTKSKNHYDTLKITPHATQNEVKSAYYKLTLQYHPDKNKSEYAKQKFQDVSNAYEVLSDHEQRKIYDRSIMLRQQPTMSTTTEDPRSRYRDKVYSGSSKIYNFDAWTHAHYGKQIYERRKRKQVFEDAKIMAEVEKRPKDKPKHLEAIVFLFTLLFIGFLLQEKTDVPASKRHKKKNKDNEN